MESTDLSLIFQEVYLKNVSYCALCFRTEKVTRLTSPRMFKKVLEALNYSKNVFHNEYICYMCEARAKAVSNFVDMVHLALEVQGVFEKANKAIGKFKKKRLLRSINDSQNSFTNMRKQTQFTNTEVLVVDAVDPIIIEATTKPAAETPETTMKTQKLQEIETVIIDDEISSYEANLPKIAPKVQQERNPLEILQPPQPILMQSSTNVNVTVGDDGFLYLLPLPMIVGDPASIEVQSPILETILMKPKSDNISRKEVSYSECAIKITDVKSVQVNEGEVVKKAKYSNDPEPSVSQKDICVSINDNDDNNNDSGNSNDESDGEVIFINGDDDKAMDYEDQVEKHPIRTDSKVDWEDKIPIDVISFVDTKSSRRTRYPAAAKQLLLKDLQQQINNC